MSSISAGLLMVIGSVLFLVGAGVAVPRVFTEPDREKKLQLLAERPGLWRLGQPLYALGAVLAALGVGFLAGDAEGTSRTLLMVACALMLVGALAWSWSVYQRAVHPREFALCQLPGWPFAAYVWLTLAGMFLLGSGILVGPWPAWLGWLVLGANTLFLGAYLRFGDIPPFVFYVLLSVAGVAVR